MHEQHLLDVRVVTSGHRTELLCSCGGVGRDGVIGGGVAVAGGGSYWLVGKCGVCATCWWFRRRQLVE